MFCPFLQQYLFMALDRKKVLSDAILKVKSLHRICFLLCSLFFPESLIQTPHHKGQKAGSFSLLTTIDSASCFLHFYCLYYFIVVKLPFLLLFLSIIVVHSFFKQLKRERKKRKKCCFCCPGSPFPSQPGAQSIMTYALWTQVAKQKSHYCLFSRNHDFPANCSNLRLYQQMVLHLKWVASRTLVFCLNSVL